MAAHWALLRGVVRIHLDRKSTEERGFVADQIVQFGKGPLRIHAIGFAGLCGDWLGAFAVFLASSFPAFGALSNICQVFQSNKRMRMVLNDVFGEGVIGLRFEPSLSLLDASHPTFRATSAFFLQAFA